METATPLPGPEPESGMEAAREPQQLDMEEEYESEGEEETKLNPEQEAEISLGEHEYEELNTESDVDIPDDDIIREEIVDSTGLKRLSYSERAQVRKRQRNLKELEILFQQKDLKVQKIREEFKECCKRIETLEKEKEEVEEDIEEQQTANNNAALFRLRAQHRRLCEELRVEEDLQSKIDLTLQANECELFKVELEHAKLTRLREEHKQDEEEYEAQRLLEAKRRLEAEEAAILQAGTRKPMKDVEKQKLEHRKAVEDAKKYNQKSIQYLKESLARTRQEEADKELKMREDLEKRMKVILSLKNNIATSRGGLRAIQAKKSAQAAAQKQKKVRASVHQESGSFLQHKLQRKRLKEFEKKKLAFTEEQKNLKAEIMAKLLLEESNMEKKKRVNPVLFSETLKSHDKSSEVWNLRKKLLHYIDTPEGEKDINTSDKEWRSPSQTSSDEPVAEQIQNTSSLDASDHEEEEESFNLPEFSGLWNKEHKLSKDETIIKHLGAGTSKMEQEILARQLEKQRSGIVQKQVAAGREFKGCPFYSKPDIIHFQNFDVGQTYTKKAKLINASYGLTSCRLIAISECLKDFIETEFKPPGQISAGMSCEIAVTFKPLVNEDFEGEIMFRTHIGSFTIPLKCTTKKCDLVVDKQVVDFGCHIIGEIITRNITLTNRGARSTYFQFVKFHPKQSIFGEELNEFIIPAEKDLFDLEQTVQTEIKVGEIMEDEIGPFSSIKLPIIFVPVLPGKLSTDLEIMFADPESENIHIETRAEAVDVPVWLSDPNKDLKICMYDRLYQDSICAHSRASTALQLKFEVCEELRNHLELLPKTGYIQAHSHFSFQLKFVPRKSLPKDAKQYFNVKTRVLEAPMSIVVANQTKTIPFTVHAIITSSDFDINPQMIDFGYCTIYEAVWTTIKLTNKSILSQEYGFVNTPEYIDVQPDDGFGVLLPLETVNIDIIFKATQAEEYAFELLCKSEINRKFKISCKAVGVFPPLKLSHSVIHFAATALNDTATVTIYVENSNTSQNPHSAPRIGKGAIVPVGPASFEFVVPEYSYLTIAPAGGTVMPGEKCIVHLTFKPTLPDQLVQEEAVRILWRAVETERILEKRDSDSTSKSLDFSKPQMKQKDVNQLNLSSSKLPVKETSSKSDSSLFELPNPTDIPLDSDDYNIALATLLRNFKEEFHSFVIPCFITHRTTDHKESGYLPYSINNTLYLEVNCPTAAPPIILISGNKQNVVDFGAIAVEQRVLKKIEIQNISQSTLDLKSSVMDPGGPFELLNSLRSLQPGATHNLIFSFTPTKSKLFYEPLEIRSVKGNLSLILTGCGIDPLVICSVESVLDVGYVLANQSRTVTFQLQNATILNVMFSVKLDSLSYSKHREQQLLPAFVTPHKISGSLVGTQNYGEQSVFSVSPIEGSIGPMQSQEFEVTFSPDHESLYYSDGMQVELFDKVAHAIQLKGAAREHLMFVEGGDPINVPVESLSILPTYEVADVPRVLKSVLLILKSTKSDNKLTTALEVFHVGCIRSTLANAKKSVDFTIDSPQALQMKGFTFDPVKAVVEAGTTKAVTVSWTPPSGYDPFQIISATVKMSVKGDITENYQIILTAMVVST
ncbi:cilia- and flagella-associated protein 74 [Scyliorhinus canicula]|uniref:cilia- and flagella-associated protein 74 n=1 Tax=Scyliorhinus canicula TaxID=7830 RepID=UPI0018F3B260|nr:cilia- and flagella-associated protein 74 [Scyliorhinus canicula]